MKALVVKELEELLREKRFPAFMTLLAVLLSFGSYMMMREVPRMAQYGYAMGFREPVLAFLFVGLVSCVLLALTFAADAIAKERDQQMLALLLTAPVTHLEIYLGKFAMLLVVYAAYAVVNLSVAALVSPAFGWVVLKTAFWLLVGPLGAFYLFLAGLGLWLSTAFKTSKAAIGAGVACVLPLFLFLKDGPLGYLLQRSKPDLYDLLGWLPAEAAVHSATALAQGEAFSWAPLASAAALGVGLAALGYFGFRAREVAV